jgi:hypothetical protein
MLHAQRDGEYAQSIALDLDPRRTLILVIIVIDRDPDSRRPEQMERNELDAVGRLRKGRKSQLHRRLD